MFNNVELNQARFLSLDNDIRLSSNNSFNANEAYENIFDDLIVEKTNSDENEFRNTMFQNLGAPAGFFLDTSMLDESGELISTDSSNHKNPNLNKYLF